MAEQRVGRQGGGGEGEKEEKEDKKARKQDSSNARKQATRKARAISPARMQDVSCYGTKCTYTASSREPLPLAAIHDIAHPQSHPTPPSPSTHAIAHATHATLTALTTLARPIAGTDQHLVPCPAPSAIAGGVAAWRNSFVHRHRHGRAGRANHTWMVCVSISNQMPGMASGVP